jgi:hypothetical protein
MDSKPEQKMTKHLEKKEMTMLLEVLMMTFLVVVMEMTIYLVALVMTSLKEEVEQIILTVVKTPNPDQRLPDLYSS